jgi:hypothetical protein
MRWRNFVIRRKAGLRQSRLPFAADGKLQANVVGLVTVMQAMMPYVRKRGRGRTINFKLHRL